MSIEKGRTFFRKQGIENRVQEFNVSSATVQLAAEAVGVEPARIAKTLSFKKDDSCILIVTAGDAKINNRKFKETFGMKASMLPAESVEPLVGHDVGGVCPFGRNKGVPVYIDKSVQRFTSVYPAVGSSNSAIELTIDELYRYSDAKNWVDVCKIPEAQ